MAKPYEQCPLMSPPRGTGEVQRAPGEPGSGRTVGLSTRNAGRKAEFRARKISHSMRDLVIHVHVCCPIEKKEKKFKRPNERQCGHSRSEKEFW